MEHSGCKARLLLRIRQRCYIIHLADYAAQRRFMENNFQLPPFTEILPLPPSEPLLQPQVTGFGNFKMGGFSADDQFVGMQNYPTAVNMNHRRTRSEIAFPSEFTFDGDVGTVVGPAVETNQQLPEVRPHIQRKRDTAASRLEEIALVDPQRARRIYANRQAALRSKERKERYLFELEHKVQSLQTQAKSLASAVDLWQKNIYSQATEKTEMEQRLKTMELQARMKEDLTNALKNEIEHIKMLNAREMKSLAYDGIA